MRSLKDYIVESDDFFFTTNAQKEIYSNLLLNGDKKSYTVPWTKHHNYVLKLAEPVKVGRKSYAYLGLVYDDCKNETLFKMPDCRQHVELCIADTPSYKNIVRASKMDEETLQKILNLVK